MNILVTGAKGMVGTALVNNLKNIRDNKNRTRPGISVNEIFEYDLDSTREELDDFCQKADFVFNLAGVNRPEKTEDFMNQNDWKYWNDIRIKLQLCFLRLFRRLCQADLAILNMDVQKRQERNCFFSMVRKMV